MAKVVLTYKKGSEEGVSSVGFFHSTEFDSMKNLHWDWEIVERLHVYLKFNEFIDDEDDDDVVVVIILG